MTRTLTVEGDVAATDTSVTLTAQGSIAAPSLVIPAGMTKIKQIYATVGNDFAAAGAATYLLRLGGNAVLGGEQTITLGAASAQDNQAGGDPSGQPSWLFKLVDADIDVRPSDTIRFAAENCGSDLGTATFAVTVVFGR